MERQFEILVYHRIGQENSVDGLTVSRNFFSDQLLWIRRYRRPLPLQFLVRSILEGRPIPSGALALTFDDGYRDTFELAFPMLQRAKIPATIFITTGYIDGEVRAYQDAPMMSWNMIRKMQRAGIEIGAHTLTHPNLRQCSLNEIKRQMVGSRHRLEDKLKIPVELFAYPYGGSRSINKVVQACARQAGFLAACTTLPGSNGPDTNRYGLRRMAPLGDQVHQLVFQLDEAARSGFPDHRLEIHGFNKKAARLWLTRYQRVRKRLLQKSPFHWQMG